MSESLRADVDRAIEEAAHNRAISDNMYREARARFWTAQVNRFQVLERAKMVAGLLIQADIAPDLAVITHHGVTEPSRKGLRRIKSQPIFSVTTGWSLERYGPNGEFSRPNGLYLGQNHGRSEDFSAAVLGLEGGLTIMTPKSRPDIIRQKLQMPYNLVARMAGEIQVSGTVMKIEALDERRSTEEISVFERIGIGHMLRGIDRDEAKYEASIDSQFGQRLAQAVAWHKIDVPVDAP
jgi:hypothetical protein